MGDLGLPIHTASNWTLVSPFGPENPVPASGPVTHYDTTLATNGDGKLYAAIAGRLTIRVPGSLIGDPIAALTGATVTDVPAIAATLFLEPLQQQMSNALRTRARPFRNLRGFVYRNIDLPSLAVAIAPLAGSLVTIGKGPVRGPAQIAMELLRGVRSLQVPAGQLLGQAAANSSNPGSREVGLSALNDAGPMDLSYVLDAMRDLITDGQPAVDEYLGVAPIQWPQISPIAPPSTIVDKAMQNIYSMAVLDTLRPERNNAISAATWRTIGDAQKALWRSRLLRGTGHASGTDTAIPFEFNDSDLLNIFQLEALTEFYANLDDPWVAGATPRPTSDPDYVTVDLLEPAGTDATVFGDVVTLNPTTDLSASAITNMLSASRKYTSKAASDTIFYDIIQLDSDTNDLSPNHAYRIINVLPAQRQVVVLGTPNVSGSSSWRIVRPPTVVIVDPFGGRPSLRTGTAATVATGGNVLALDGQPDLGRINDLVDMIYVPGDTARASRTYRILGHDQDQHTVKVDGSPILAGGSSRWHIPAGLSGFSDARFTPSKSAGAAGYDHYDGALFVVHRGVIIDIVISWSSYTSWESDVPTKASHPLSSIRGNSSYALNSYRSSDSFKNYSFRVTDHDLSFNAPSVPQLPDDSDSVAECRTYFKRTTTPPIGPDVSRLPNGAAAIRLHVGNKTGGSHKLGTGSEGCLVSVDYGVGRAAMIRAYRADYELLHGVAETVIHRLEHCVDSASSARVYDSSGAQGITYALWNTVIVGELWLIRPEELPLS